VVGEHEPLSGLYYKHTTIVNYVSSVVNKLEALLTDDIRVVIYDRRVFIVQDTDDVVSVIPLLAILNSGLYCKCITIVIDAPSVVSKWRSKL
jgi:hypothetical protein